MKKGNPREMYFMKTQKFRSDEPIGALLNCHKIKNIYYRPTL